MTIGQALHDTCYTGSCAGLSHQLITKVNELVPGLLLPVSHPLIRPKDSNVWMYLQARPRAALIHAAEEYGRVLVIASCLRMLPQQVMLRAWKEAGRCGITEAAHPGESKHESGAAVDVSNAGIAARAILAEHDWFWFGRNDPAHYTHHSLETRGDLAHVTVRAFQMLANEHNDDGVLLKVDGVFGDRTRAAVLAAPVEGWH